MQLQLNSKQVKIDTLTDEKRKYKDQQKLLADKLQRLNSTNEAYRIDLSPGKRVPEVDSEKLTHLLNEVNKPVNTEEPVELIDMAKAKRVMKNMTGE